MSEVRLASLTVKDSINVNLTIGAVFVSYQPNSYFGQPWSLKDKKKGLTVHVSGFGGTVDYDIFGDIEELTAAEATSVLETLPLQPEQGGVSVTVRGAARIGKSVGLIRINFRKDGEVTGSAAIVLKFWRGRVDVLPLPYADYSVPSVVTGRGGPDADWHFQAGFADLAELAVRRREKLAKRKTLEE